MKQRTTSLTAIAIILIAVLGVIGWRVWTANQRAEYLRHIADELGSIAEYRAPVIPNHANTRAMLALDAENGPGIYLFDIGAGTKKLLYEEDQHHYYWPLFRLWDWSPDDRLFAYIHQTAPNVRKGELIIADGTSGDAVAKIHVPYVLSKFAWLSDNSFVCLNAGQDLAAYERKPDGSWLQTRFYTNATAGNTNEAEGFATTSTNSVAWRMRGAIWNFDVAAGTATKIWEATNSTLQESFYSPEIGQFLLTCNSTNGRFLYAFDPSTKSTSIFKDLGRRDPTISMSWINQGKGYTFLSNFAGMFSALIQTNLATEPFRLLGLGEMRYCTAANEKVYVVGSLTNEPRGIWEYTVASGSLRCVLPGSENPFKHARIAATVTDTITNTNIALVVRTNRSGAIVTNKPPGREMTYHLWVPNDVSSGKKYPAVLGCTPYSWTPYPQAAANMGYYFLTVDRPDWNVENLTNWAGSVTRAYEVLAENPNVDTNRIFIYARSAESQPMSKLLKEKPALWRGAIFFDPTHLPEVSTPHLPKMFIAAGEEDPPILKVVRPYEKKASEAGIEVTLVILKKAPHDAYGNGTQRERTQHFVQFLSKR